MLDGARVERVEKVNLSSHEAGMTHVVSQVELCQESGQRFFFRGGGSRGRRHWRLALVEHFAPDTNNATDGEEVRALLLIVQNLGDYIGQAVGDFIDAQKSIAAIGCAALAVQIDR